MNPFTTGGKPRPQDNRDYSIPLGTATIYPEIYPSPVLNIYMQSRFGTCGAHAGAALANVLFNAKTSPKFLWKMIKTIDLYGIYDGTDMRSIFRALQQFGICDYDLLPNPTEVGEYPANITIEAYSDISEITQAMKDNAATRKISNYAFTDNPTFEQIKQAIYEHKAVILLVDCGDGWWTPSWAAANPLHEGKFVGHHFTTATEYGLTLIDGANSWSIDWGNDGKFEMNADYIPHVLEMGIATVNVIPPTKYQFTKDFGMFSFRFTDVSELQKILIAGGYADFKTATGFFGTLTFQAVQKYQIAHGIPSTGYVGPLTRAKLNT